MDYIKCEIPKKNCHVRTADNNCGWEVVCQEIVEQCIGCSHIENNYCQAYILPVNRWNTGKECTLASHLQAKKLAAGKVRIGQQKQKKKTRH